MEFYKKNPVIEHDVTIQGVMLEDDTIVCGDEFAMFADPSTFPGKPPKLVKADPNKFSTKQEEQVREFMKARQMKPPRHMGAVTTSNFKMSGEVPGEARIKISEPVRKVKAPVPKPVKKVVSSPRKKAPLKEEEAPKISELMTAGALADHIPGITSNNARKVIKKFETFDDLAQASNVDLRAAGVRSNFFVRVRKEAKKLAKEMKE